MSVVVRYRMEGLEIDAKYACELLEHHNMRSCRLGFVAFDIEGMLGPFEQAAVVLVDEDITIEATDLKGRTWTLARAEGMGWWVQPAFDNTKPGEGSVQPLRFPVFEVGFRTQLRIESAPDPMPTLTVVGMNDRDVMLYSRTTL